MVNFNGDLLPESAHFLNHTNRGLRFGDALSEAIRFDGEQLLFWEDHYFRLMACMRQLRMEIPMQFNMEFAEAEVRKTLTASGLEGRPARIGITVFRRDGLRSNPDSLEVSYVIEAEPLPEKIYTLPGDEFRADLFKDYYLHADPLARLNHNNRILEVLAGIYASENGYQTCIMLNHRKEVVSGLGGNLFIRKGEQIRTPSLDSGCPDGILRKQLLRLGEKDTPYTWEATAVSPFELQQADELFLADVIGGIRPVTAYRKAGYTTDAAAYLVERLNREIGSQG